LNPSSPSSETLGVWRKFAALLLVIAALGLPINDLFRYALLLAASVAIFAGEISPRPKAWLAAAAIAVIATLGQSLLSAQRIEEGHNVFLVDGANNALVAGLPAEAYRLMAEQFDAAYPPQRRCDPRAPGCWQGQGRPDRVYAFSADGIYDRPMFSRRIADIDFSDPIWLRLGFINELRYNWYSGASDIQRNAHERSVRRLLHPWRLMMPFFVVYRFPAAYVGSALCWQGEVLWQGPGEQFERLRHDETVCRTLEDKDIGRLIFGMAIARDAKLAMKLQPTLTIRLRQYAAAGLTLIGGAGVLGLLVRWERRRLVLPFALIGLALLVVFLHDPSFIGGVRPFDGGDDGLVYDGWGRSILQHLVAGDISRALEGEEKVFYFTPGMRYLRAIEHLIFGETYLGYLSLILLLPFLFFATFRRFLTARTALALTLIFIVIPIGALFGSTFYLFVKWAARGFADPAAAIMFLAGYIALVGRSKRGPDIRFAPAFGAGLLFALALFLRPNLAPGAAVLLTGAGLAALWQIEYRRLAGMCIGFLPVFGMALHNWVYGGAFVLFSSNATLREALPMTPAAYLAAFGELLRLDFTGEHIVRAGLQIARWLTGPSESFAMVPLHAVAIAVVVRVAFSRRYDPWLCLVAVATLAEHAVTLFYIYAARYNYLAWLLTLLICSVWMKQEGVDLLQRHFPRLAERMQSHPARLKFKHSLDWCARVTGIA
jgi:hypothetical protein